MTKEELVKAVAAESAETQETVETILTDTIAQITGALGAGLVVDLAPLGRFVPRQEAAHQGSNPQTHEPMEIPAHTRVLFHPAKSLHDAVNPAGA